MTHSRAWAEGLLTQDHPLLPTFFLLQLLLPWRRPITSDRRKGMKNRKHRSKTGRQKTEDRGQNRKKGGRGRKNGIGGRPGRGEKEETGWGRSRTPPN